MAGSHPPLRKVQAAQQRIGLLLRRLMLKFNSRRQPAQGRAQLPGLTPRGRIHPLHEHRQVMKASQQALHLSQLLDDRRLTLPKRRSEQLEPIAEAADPDAACVQLNPALVRPSRTPEQLGKLMTSQL